MCTAHTENFSSFAHANTLLSIIWYSGAVNSSWVDDIRRLEPTLGIKGQQPHLAMSLVKQALKMESHRDALPLWQ
jgi:hypothetical protein